MYMHSIQYTVRDTTPLHMYKMYMCSAYTLLHTVHVHIPVQHDSLNNVDNNEQQQQRAQIELELLIRLTTVGTLLLDINTRTGRQATFITTTRLLLFLLLNFLILFFLLLVLPLLRALLRAFFDVQSESIEIRRSTEKLPE